MSRISWASSRLLLAALCLGTAWSNSIHRIIGGSDINIEQVPYMLSYRLFGKHVCGACILNEYWGLTAAHCVSILSTDPLEAITIRSGSSLRDQGGMLHDVQLVWMHEQYDASNTTYDIAVFQVKQPFRMGATRQPVKLPWDYSTVDTSWGLVAGWGYFLESDPVLSDTLQYVIVPRIYHEKCVNDYKYRFFLSFTEVCYGFQTGGKDSCKGDSGGPLVNGQGVLIGITSWGAGCGEQYSPGVYTDVPLLHKWVLRKIKFVYKDSHVHHMPSKNYFIR